MDLNIIKKQLLDRFIANLELKYNVKTNRWDTRSSIDLSNCGLTRLPLKFGDILGGFDCSENLLTSIEDMPLSLGTYFYCNHNRLTSLKGLQIDDLSQFDCSHNLLTDLEGGPQKNLQYYWCNNNRLTSLRGGPQEVEDSFYCTDNQLTSLEGAPHRVDNFYCYNNLIVFEKPSWLSCNYFYNYDERLY